jgi:NAD(P)-dependent dehydrogenase (short-subunit alcohol dehydrogenase family)
MKNLKNKVAAITGAGSGIGRMLAIGMAAESCHLAISDVNAAGLKETEKLIGKGVKVSTHIVDVSRQDQVIRFAKEAAERHGGIDIIINNAGVALGDFLETVPIEDFEWLMGINFWGVVYGTMAFLPYLRKRPEGHIVNISSINGIVSNPNNGPYSASKYAVRGYTETLIQEMKGTNIGVSCVHPGGIKTNIAKNTKVNKTYYSISSKQAAELYDKEVFRTTAEQAARVIINGIKRNQQRVMIGYDAKILDLFMRFFPQTSVNITAIVAKRMAKKYAGMKA